MILSCTICSREYELWDARWRCECGAPLTWDGDSLAVPGKGVWEHAWLLPPVDAASRVTLGEGATPLVHGYKLEALAPTGSFKDRGAAVVASCLRQAGVGRAVFDSSGNAGAAMSAYMAAAGIEAVVFAPADASPAKLRQIAAYGAQLQLVDGSRTEVTARAQAWASEHGDVYASHLWSPFFSCGMRTVAAELGQVGAVVMPVGSGSLLIGLHDGFVRLRKAGMIDDMPALYGVQATAYDPLVAAFEGRPPETGVTVAEGIRIAAPPRAAEVLAAVRASGGALIGVREEQIRDAARSLARRGLLVEPTAAVSEAGRVSLGLDSAVVVLTGTGLKTLA